DSVDGDVQNRFYLGGGLRISTALWRVYETINSDLFDIHRVRHVIEPEVNFFASTQSVDHNELFIYDSQVDQINDIQAAQIALRQRWQTKRGGPGRWRNVDFLTLGISADLFANQPPPAELAPQSFRGVFFPTLPEASIPRNSLNMDLTWRVSDT